MKISFPDGWHSTEFLVWKPAGIVLPCHKELNPEAVGDLKQELNASMILAEQITTISKLQLRKYVGRVADADLLVAIDQTIREQLGLSGPDRHDNDHHSTKNKECDCNDHK